MATVDLFWKETVAAVTIEKSELSVKTPVLNLSVNLDDTLEFIRVLWALDESLQILSRRMELRLGVTGPQRMVLRLISRFPGIPASVISQILKLHSSTVNNAVHSLEAKGHLVRIITEEDGPSGILELTESGLAIAKPQDRTIESAVRAFVQGRPGDYLNQARKVLDQLSRKLKEEVDRDSR